MSFTISDKSKLVDRRPMTFKDKIYLPAILGGLKVTLGHILKKKATINYPEVQREFSSTFRGLHILNKDEETGFFSSNRKGGKGDIDIYQFKIEKPFSFN